MESFQEAYAKVLNRAVVHGKLKHAHDDKVAQALKLIYDKLACNGSGADARSLLEMPLASRSECLLLMAMDLLGNTCLNEGQSVEALQCFKMAHVYYADKFDRNFVKPRELKRKMAKILLNANFYSEVLEELKDDVESESYETALDAEITLYLKYAYGRSLVAKGLQMEAIPYLSHKQLGQMNYDKKLGMVISIRVIMKCWHPPLRSSWSS